MAPISKKDAKDCCENALKLIADFSQDCNIEDLTFAHWHDIHKLIFINSVASCITKKGSRIVLNEGMLDNTNTLGEFIQYVYENSVYLNKSLTTLTVSKGDLQ